MIIEFLWHPKTALVLVLFAAGAFWAYRTAMDQWAAEALNGPKKTAAEDLLGAFGLTLHSYLPPESSGAEGYRFSVRYAEEVNRIARTGMRPWPFYRALRRIADDPSGEEAMKLKWECDKIERRLERIERTRRRIG